MVCRHLRKLVEIAASLSLLAMTGQILFRRECSDSKIAVITSEAK